MGYWIYKERVALVFCHFFMIVVNLIDINTKFKSQKTKLGLLIIATLQYIWNITACVYVVAYSPFPNHLLE
jgi:hypothetical protein